MSTDFLSDCIVSFDAYDPEHERQREALFALGNGAVVTRSAAPDQAAGERHYPGTYRAGCYNRLFAEIAGEEVETESLVNLPNWLPLTFRIDGGEWFSIDAAEILDYRHLLDVRRGLARRELTFRDGHGRRTRLSEERFVSMAERTLMALRLEFEPLEWSGQIEFQSALDGNVENTNVRRFAPYPGRHLSCFAGEVIPDLGVLLHTRTRHSGIDIVQVQRSTLSGARATMKRVEKHGDGIAEIISCAARQSHAVDLEKTTALVTSRDPAISEPRHAARTAVERAPDYATLKAEHEAAWRHLWSRVSIDIGPPDIARPVLLHTFHILQTVSPHTIDLDAGVPARGWNEAYHGHIFWDDIFVFHFLDFRFPALARALLRYRYRRLSEARAAARQCGYRGAMFPWRSASDGREVTPRHQLNLASGRWMQDPTRLQHHIGCAIAYNIWHHYLATGDTDFLAELGAEMLLEFARFWASKVEYDHESDRFDIHGVIGPDEYHNANPGAGLPGLDNNAYTNVMVVWTLCRALEVLDHLPARRARDLAERLGLAEEEFAHWEQVSRRMRIEFHGDGIISQYAGFDRLREFDPGLLPPNLRNMRADWALEAIGQTADLYKVVKQADTLTLFYLLEPREVVSILNRLGYTFGPKELRNTANYYLHRTTHRSSLSRIVYAGALVEMDPSLSWELFVEALGTDLHAMAGESTEEGIHLGAMAGTLDVLQRRYVGLAACREGLTLRPALPEQLTPFRMNLEFRGAELHAENGGNGIRISSEAANNDEITVVHPGGRVNLRPGQSIFVPA